MSNLRNKIIRLAHENPELRSDLLPLLQQAKVASMPPANKRPASEKARSKWADWFKTDIQTKLEQAGVPQSAIDHVIDLVCDYRYGVLRATDYRTRKFTYFVTNADIHAWVTGRAKVSDVSPNYQGVFREDTESYPMMLKSFIAEYGSANSGALRDKAKAMFNKCKDYQLVLAACLLSHEPGNRSFRSNMGNPSSASKELEESINGASSEYLKKVMTALEWASKCPEPPKSALSL